MVTTTFFDASVTKTWNGSRSPHCSEKLFAYYTHIIQKQHLDRVEKLSFTKMLGQGGQGVVYLTHRHGTDGFSLPIAVKIFSPERYHGENAYNSGMNLLAQVASHVSKIQHDNLLDVLNWFESDGIRLMEMEYVDGFDINELLRNEMLEHLRIRVNDKMWNHLREVIVTNGHVHPRLKPGVAIAIAQECLSALSALHREGVVHGDIKPSNIMLKRTGNAKIIDIGSAFELTNPPEKATCTPLYAAPEVLAGERPTPLSDLASLGYLVIEMLSGVAPFDGRTNHKDLLEAKHFLAQKLSTILPVEVVSNELLMNFCRKLIAPDPSKRFQNAEAANYLQDGAVGFQRQLIRGNLASEYDNDIRVWLSLLDDYEPQKNR
ncbi:MAG: serine/threonine protein kinase [Planctomycetaceae bacterium]|jgi:serine/threonine-protein kinase|nr:serine/threonine protein kinase [Planctomycetaceae bacterium]